jgi:hypothetical protein
MPSGGKRKGAGRKSAYGERADAAMLWEMFFGAQDKEKISAMLKTGKYSLKDVFLSKAFAGNERILVEIFKKLFPDLEKVDHQGGLVIKLVDYEKHDREELREMPADDDPKAE